MDRKSLEFAFSPCPNDTFSFHAWVDGLVPGPKVVARLADIETLNQRAASGEALLTKLSVAAFGRVRSDYVLLRAGGAAGYGVGPIVVTRKLPNIAGHVAVPGVRTTAALLLRLVGDFETVSMPFHEIQDAVLSGQVDCGVLIHEGRFTYREKGLRLLADLGEIWEQRMRCPVPLGAVAMRRDLALEWAAQVTHAIQFSVDYALSHPYASRGFVEMHAQELTPGIIERHIQLYVNKFTREMDEHAVQRLLDFGLQNGAFLPTADSLPTFASIVR